MDITNDPQWTIDPWVLLSHRPILNPDLAASNSLMPSWVGPPNSSDRRRLDAYNLLKSYVRNAARRYLREVNAKRESREYGDAALIGDAILAALLGEEITVQVEGADADDPVEPIPPNEPADGASPEDRQRFTEEQSQFDDDMAEFETRQAERDAAVDRQAWFDRWWSDVKGPLKLIETERNSVDLGDGVYLVGWDATQRRVRLRVYDPGFYFPVLGDDVDDEFPDRVHLAWEFIGDDDKPKVRRITFERRKLDAPVSYPYQSDTSEFATFLTDATWDLEQMSAAMGRNGVKKPSPDRIPYGAGETYAQDADGDVKNRNIGVDFMPVVHIPNTVALLEHFGVSAIALVAQILDDLINNDTNMQAAAGVVGVPPIAIEGNQRDPNIKTYGPAVVLWGKVSVVDTSSSLDALLKYTEQLLKRLSVNARIPEEVLGRVKAGDIASGVALALSFAPFRSLINQMRLVRDDKYSLLFKMVQRFAMVGADGAGTVEGRTITPAKDGVLEVRLAFGSYLPNDLKATVDMILALLDKHGVSRATALRLLAAAGLDLGDLSEELQRIEHEDFEAAGALADAIGDENEARRFLGIDTVDEPQPVGPASPPGVPAPPGVPGPTPPGVPPPPSPAGGGRPTNQPPPQPGG